MASDLCCLHRRRIKQVERQRDQNSSERKYGDAAHLRQQVAPSGDKVPRAVYDPRGAAGQGERRLAREERETKLQTTSFFSRKKKKNAQPLSSLSLSLKPPPLLPPPPQKKRSSASSTPSQAASSSTLASRRYWARPCPTPARRGGSSAPRSRGLRASCSAPPPSKAVPRD